VNPNGRGYLRGGYVSSFAGFLPANDPKFVIYVAVDHPRKGYYGGSVAGPIFANVARFAVRHAGLAPVVITAQNVVPTARRAETQTQAPLKALEDVAEADVTTTLSSEVAPSVAMAAAQVGDGVVPDLTGLTLREVVSRVSGEGVNVTVHGQGFVTRTLPPGGARLSENKELNVFLEQ